MALTMHVLKFSPGHQSQVVCIKRILDGCHCRSLVPVREEDSFACYIVDFKASTEYCHRLPQDLVDEAVEEHR